MPDTPQARNLRRVRSTIGPTVVAFWAECVASSTPEFTAQQLVRYVALRHPMAPDSPSRILRALRQAGEVNYVVVNRAASQYRALPLAAPPAG